MEVIKQFFENFKRRYCLNLTRIHKYTHQSHLYFRYSCPKNYYRWGSISYFSDLIANSGLLGFKGKVQVWATKTRLRLCNNAVYEGYSGYIGSAYRYGRVILFSKPIKIPLTFYYYDYGKSKLSNAVNVYFPENFDTSFCNDFSLFVYDWNNYCWNKVNTNANCYFHNGFVIDILYPYSNEVRLGVHAWDIYGHYYYGGLLAKFVSIDEILVNDYFLNRLANAIGLNIPKHLNKILKIIGG